MSKKVEKGFTQEKLDALECAIAEGILEVQYSDKRVRYRTLKEMTAIRNLMAKKLNKCKPKSGGLFGGRRLKAEHDKDLC